MAKKGLLDAAQKTVVEGAKVGAESAKDVASDALGAAASAAAGVVLGRVSKALGTGQTKAEQAPAAPRPASPSKARPIRKPAKKRVTAKQRLARRQTGKRSEGKKRRPIEQKQEIVHGQKNGSQRRDQEERNPRTGQSLIGDAPALHCSTPGARRDSNRR